MTLSYHFGFVGLRSYWSSQSICQTSKIISVRSRSWIASTSIFFNPQNVFNTFNSRASSIPLAFRKDHEQPLVEVIIFVILDIAIGVQSELAFITSSPTPWCLLHVPKLVVYVDSARASFGPSSHELFHILITRGLTVFQTIPSEMVVPTRSAK